MNPNVVEGLMISVFSLVDVCIIQLSSDVKLRIKTIDMHKRGELLDVIR